MQATRQPPPTAHVTRFDAALAEDAAARADLAALGGAPDAPGSEALIAALWIGAAAGVLPAEGIAGMQTTARNWRAAEDAGIAALRKAAQGEGPVARQAARDLRRTLIASRAGRLAAIVSWAVHAAPPPGPGAAEDNAARLLAQGGAAPGRVGGAEAQARLGRLVEASGAAMARAVAAAQADQAEADTPDPISLAAFTPRPDPADDGSAR